MGEQVLIRYSYFKGRFPRKRLFFNNREGKEETWDTKKELDQNED